jgi:HEPN domain-containing protein
MSDFDSGIESSGAPLADQFSDALLQQLFDIFVEPELKRRGNALLPQGIKKVLITLPPSAPPYVELNDEVQLIARTTVNRSIEKGEPVTEGDIEQIASLSPVTIDSDAGWVAILRVKNQFTIQFDFRRNRGRTNSMLDLAEQFLRTAQRAFEGGDLAPAVDTALAAMELAIKANLLLLWDEPIRRHDRRVDLWEGWVQLGNAPAHLESIPRSLLKERDATRYGDAPMSMTTVEVQEAIEAVAATMEHVRTMASDP